MSGMLCFYIAKPVIYTLWSRHNERRGQRDSIELSALICSFMKMFGETLYSESLIFVFFGVFLWTYVDDNLRSHGGSLLYQDDCVAPRHWSWVSLEFPPVMVNVRIGGWEADPRSVYRGNFNPERVTIKLYWIDLRTQDNGELTQECGPESVWAYLVLCACFSSSGCQNGAGAFRDGQNQEGMPHLLRRNWRYWRSALKKKTCVLI